MIYHYDNNVVGAKKNADELNRWGQTCINDDCLTYNEFVQYLYDNAYFGDLELMKILRKKIGRIGRRGLTVEERKLAVSIGVIPG
jgi:hypothetical protein